MALSAPPQPAATSREDTPPPPSSGDGGFSASNLRKRLRRPPSLLMRTKELVIEKLLLACGYVSIAAVLLIFIFLFKEGFVALRMVEDQTNFLYSEQVVYEYDAVADTTVAVDTRTAFTWQPVQVDEKEPPKLSIIPLAWASFGVALISALLSTVLGIAVGVYMSEMASRRLRDFIKPALELLVGIPTVVIGFFMLAVIAVPVHRLLSGGGSGQGLVPFYNAPYNMFIGAVGVSVVIIPVIASLVDDAMRAVPQDLRAASLSLGATRWQTTWKVVLPAGVSGVIAAVILGFGRALGETMIVLMCAGNAPQITVNPFESVRTMTAAIAAEMGAAQQGSLHSHSLFFVGAILVTVAFVLNLVVEIVVNRYRKKIRL